MESVINIGTFVQQLTYYIKMGIYINKGTDKENVFQNCIKLYNKLKVIENSKETTNEDEMIIRKCLKRLNLVLKVDKTDNPVNVREKENQLKIIQLKEHSSLVEDNLAQMIEYATKHNIDILTGIPLVFMLRESKYQELLWQYTRSLFYLSQALIVTTNRKQMFDDCLDKLETILTNISDLEEKIKINEVMTLDNFLNNTLVKSGINEKNVNDARMEVKEIFNKKGLGNNNSMSRMIDSISDKLTNVDLTQGNIIQSMFGIAQNVASEMRGDLENNPEQFQNTLSAITEVFKDAMDDSAKNGEEMPADLKNMLGMISSVAPNMGLNLTGAPTGDILPAVNGENDIKAALEQIITTNGLDRNDFFGSIKDGQGEIDVNKLEDYLKKLDQ